MRKLAHGVTIALLALGLGADGAIAAPANLPDQPLDLELREAEVANVFRLLAEVSKRDVVLDPCVKGKIDLKLKNAPIPVVFDVLAAKLDLRYETQGEAIWVGCKVDGQPLPAPDARLQRRVSADVRGASVRSVLTELAKAAGLDGVDYHGDENAQLTLSVTDVRLSTMLSVIADKTALRLGIDNGRLVAVPAKP